MKRLMLLLAILLLVSPVAAQRSKDEKTEIAVVAMEIGKEIPGDPKNRSGFRRRGVALTMAIRRADKFFIGMDKGKSKLVSFTDDKGTDLLKKTGRLSSGGISMFPKFSADGHLCLFGLRGATAPTKGATSLQVKGHVALRYAEGEKTAVQKNMKLTKGSKLTVGSVPWTIKRVGKPNWGDAKVAVTVEGNVSHDAIKKLVFLDADGKEVEHTIGGRSTLGEGERMTYGVEYKLKRKVDVVSVKVICFEKTGILTVPIDLEFGLGL